MLGAVLVVIIILWLLGFVNLPFIPFLYTTLFSINGHPITLINLIMFFAIASLIELLPTPFNIIAGIILLLWVLSILGILAIGGLGLSNILVLAVIIGLVLMVLGFV